MCATYTRMLPQKPNIHIYYLCECENKKNRFIYNKDFLFLSQPWCFTFRAMLPRVAPSSLHYTHTNETLPLPPAFEKQ